MLLTSAFAADAPDNYTLGLSTEIVTPHFTWAKPYARGTTRVLVIAPAWGQRETVELRQRFDFDCRAVMTNTSNLLAQEAGFLAPDKVALQFDQGLAWKPDVIVIGGLNWSMLLIEHRYGILKLLQDGAGLVYVGPPKNDELAQLFAQDASHQSAPILAGVPWSYLTAFRDVKPEDIINTGGFGKGRWVTLNYRTNSTNQSLTPSLWPWPANWEYEPCLNLVGRAILYAAKKEPAPMAWVDAQTLARAALPGKMSVLRQLSLGARGVNLTPTFVRLPDGQMTSGSTVPVGTQVPVPALPIGQYLVNIIMTAGADQAISGWGTVSLEITAPRHNPKLIVPPGFDAGQEISGSYALGTPLLPGETLTLSLTDNHGRLLGQSKPTAAQGAFNFGQVQPLGTSVHTLEAVISDAKGEVERASQQIAIRYRPRPAFHLACWEEPEVDYISGLWYQRLRELGMDAIFYRSDRGNRDAAARMIAAADLFGASAFAGYHPKVEPSDLGPVHNPCLHDPAYQQAAREAAHRSEPFALHDNLFYPSGSDAGMRGNCFSPQTLAAFRQWLQQRYKSLAELNATWGTQFGSFEVVIPSSFDKLKSGGNVTSWLEHTRFMESAYREHLQDVAQTIRGFDPQALVGEDGYGWLNSTDGADWWNLLHDWGFVNLYTYQDPPQMEIVRSLCRSLPHVKLRSLYWGSYDGQFGNLRFMRTLPWYALLHDYNGLFWWVANGKTTWPAAPPLAGPDFRANRTYLTSLREIEAIRDGIAELIQPATRRHDGVAIYYDQTAVHAVSAYKHPSALVQAYTVFQDLLEDLGVQYNYVAGGQVEQGLLPREGYQVLVMAQALALSDAQAQQVRDFVNRGGTIIADVLPGQYDAYLRPAPNGSLLADLFGQPGTAKTVGKGWTHLMSDWPARYHYQRTDTAARQAREKMQTLLAGPLGARLVTFRGPDETMPPGVEVVTYEHAGAHFVGFLNDTAQPISGRARMLPSPHIYDVRARQYLGQTNEWPVQLEPGETKLYALLPYEVAGVTAQPLDAAVVGRPCRLQLTVRAATGAAGPAHSFVVRVADPTGKPRDEYRQALPADAQGRALATVPFALNDSPGAWQVRVMETVSGKSAAPTLDLKAK
jgi:hypothetical protein